MMKRNSSLPLTIISAGLAATFSAYAAEIPTNTAQMQAMDKITGRVSVINVPVNSETTFGSFSIVVRDCKTRSPEETPENYAFVDVVDTTVGQENVNIFKGWMLSSSPALNAVEHPVYDVWLLKCIDTDTSKTTKLSAEELKVRDETPLLRSTSPTEAPQIVPVRENENVNLSGEPIDLLPMAVREAGEEDAAQEEVIKLEIIDETPMADAERNPQSLLNIDNQPAAIPNNEPQEINAKIEITEQTADETGGEIKSDARVLSLPEATPTANTVEPVAATEVTAPAEPQNLISEAPEAVSEPLSEVITPEVVAEPVQVVIDEPAPIVSEPQNLIPEAPEAVSEPLAEAITPEVVAEPVQVVVDEPAPIVSEPQNLIPEAPVEISAPLVEPITPTDSVAEQESVPATQPTETDPIAELEKQLSIEALNN